MDEESSGSTSSSGAQSGSAGSAAPSLQGIAVAPASVSCYHSFYFKFIELLHVSLSSVTLYIVSLRAYSNVCLINSYFPICSTLIVSVATARLVHFL